MKTKIRLPQSVRLSDLLGLAARAVCEVWDFIGWMLLGRHGGPGWGYWMKVLAAGLLAACLELWLLTGAFAPLVLWEKTLKPVATRLEQRLQGCPLPL